MIKQKTLRNLIINILILCPLYSNATSDLNPHYRSYRINFDPSETIYDLRARLISSLRDDTNMINILVNGIEIPDNHHFLDLPLSTLSNAVVIPNFSLHIFDNITSGNQMCTINRGSDSMDGLLNSHTTRLTECWLLSRSTELYLPETIRDIRQLAFNTLQINTSSIEIVYNNVHIIEDAMDDGILDLQFSTLTNPVVIMCANINIVCENLRTVTENLMNHRYSRILTITPVTRNIEAHDIENQYSRLKIMLFLGSGVVIALLAFMTTSIQLANMNAG